MNGLPIDRSFSPSSMINCMMVMLAAAVATAIICLGCGEKVEPAPKAVVRPVKVMTVQGSGGREQLAFAGKTRAHRREDLSFKVPGPLVELPVEEGQEIKKGLLIFFPEEGRDAWMERLNRYVMDQESLAKQG